MYNIAAQKSFIILECTITVNCKGKIPSKAISLIGIALICDVVFLHHCLLSTSTACQHTRQYHTK